MKAYSANRPEISIENPLFVSVRYGEDTPGFYVIEPDLIREYGAAWSDNNAVAELIEPGDALAMIERGAWFGIKEATIAGVCSAWGHARIEA